MLDWAKIASGWSCKSIEIKIPGKYIDISSSLCI